MLITLKVFFFKKTGVHFGVLEKLLQKHPDRNSNNNKRLQTFVILNAKNSNLEGKYHDSKLGRIRPSSTKTAERYFQVHTDLGELPTPFLEK